MQMKQKSKMLGFKLIVSHLSIAFMGAVFLILSLLFHESLSNKIFNLVLDSSPRVEYLNNISTNLKSSHAELLEEALFKNGTPEHRQSIWRKEIWTSLDKLEQRSKRQWNIQDKNKKLNEIKSLLSEIYVQQWKIEDIANTSANSQATYILQSQALPQAKNMEHHIEALIFLLKKQSHTIITADILILFMELRLAINGSLSALERIGYAHEIHARVDYEHYINEFEFTMKKLKKYKSYFTPEMLDIFKWLKLEEKAYIKLEKIIENSTQTITEKIFNNYLNPLDISVFKLLNEITKELKEDRKSVV